MHSVLKGGPCGYLTDPRRRCRCTPRKIQQYLGKISGQLLDRIDLHIEVPAVPFQTLRQAMEELHVSARAYDKILKIARTIADLDESDLIHPPHVAEALQYRSLDRQFWG